MATWNVSPKFTNEKLKSGKLEDKIDVFEDQIYGLLLLHARELCSEQYKFRKLSGFAVLTLTSTYFEAIESFCTGLESKDRSKEFFRKGFLRTFPGFTETLRKNSYPAPEKVAEKVVDCIYEQLRCGLFHEAMTKSKLVIREDTAPMGFMLEESTGDVGSIVIDPCRFLSAIEEHFRNYVQALRNPVELQLRSNFQKFFDLRMARPGAVPVPPVSGS